jgi:DNA ligase D-like protein (predicted 3'-phosphoesterase)
VSVPKSRSPATQTATALQRYRSKRDFERTPEPEAAVRKRRAKARMFVVQKHQARRLHYDFRLELDGVLLSWAVPKGPSLDPKDKRMAVRTEDHPLAYADFEGTIPAGNYGAGTVIVWDRGRWMPLEDPHDGLRRGKLAFELQGHKLQGRWEMVRMRKPDERQEAWLLFKQRDAAARARGTRTCSMRCPPASWARGLRPRRLRRWLQPLQRRCHGSWRRNWRRWPRRCPHRGSGSSNRSSTATACWPASKTARRGC